MGLNLPVRHNAKLKLLQERIDADEELQQIWRCANINAVDRLAMSDHGNVHIRIVSNAALRLLRLLLEAEIKPSLEVNYGALELGSEDAEVVVVLASCLHDLGISVHRDDHELYSLALAPAKIKELLEGMYTIPQRAVIQSETLHAIVAHQWEVTCLTLEAGVVKVADALDMTQGRSRITFQSGDTNIHSVSAAAIDAVNLVRGEAKPIRVEIRMSNSAGIFQVDELLKRKLHHSSIAQHVEVVAHIETETEKSLVQLYKL
ncbi:MAG: phosphohydrolase [Chloroflexi bacterium]|nr:phosphohydrolase [Chloroflexota bacterium]